MATLDDVARSVHALEPVDGSHFRRCARVLQSLWREQQGYPCGEHRGRRLGSRLPMPWAKETLANYLTENVREVVRHEVIDSARAKGKLYGKPRIYNDLLSSQPLAFNLFAELQRNLTLASSLIQDLTTGRFRRVDAVDFEESPGRSDPRYTGDRSAFDVFLRCRTESGAPAFLGIEVKYHEHLKDKPASHRPRYDELAAAMGCFKPEALPALRDKPLQQIWRDHLLAGALLADGPFRDGAFIFLHPEGNPHCTEALAAYQACLVPSTPSFASWTLEGVVATLKNHTQAEWVGLFEDRYLDFGKVDRALAKATIESE